MKRIAIWISTISLLVLIYFRWNDVSTLLGWAIGIGILLYVFKPLIIAIGSFLIGILGLVMIGGSVYLAFTNPSLLLGFILGGIVLIGLVGFLLAFTIETWGKKSSKNKFIRKEALADRETLREERLSSAEEAGFLGVSSLEESGYGLRPVGTLAIVSSDILRERKDDNSFLTTRSSERRYNNPPQFWDKVQASGDFHRTHTVPFYYCLDEGETRGVTFCGTSLLDNGEPYLTEENEHEHKTLVTYLFDDFLDTYKNNLSTIKRIKENTGYDQPVCYYEFPVFDFDELIDNSSISDDTVLKVGERLGGGGRFSMLHFERLSDWIINYFKTDEFIYSCELHYSSYDDYLVSDVELILYNRTKEFVAFRALLANEQY